MRKIKKILYKYHLTSDCVYSQWCEKMGLHGEIEVTESEIISKIKEAYQFLDKFGLKEEDLFMVGGESEEM